MGAMTWKLPIVLQSPKHTPIDAPRDSLQQSHRLGAVNGNTSILSLKFLIAGDVVFGILDNLNSIKGEASQDPLNDHLQEETRTYV
ncbi:unnamed protein product [Dovyalis caffra]|uniref:Uncharacterized protein n=1 Tax=Dovyalis caffra TaxID=77055 RepID=A0AAV1QUV9_9ROSI|nr:unnamed protein product [Dovyalis caffra]